MKLLKVGITVFVLALIFASCKRDYSCTCYIEIENKITGEVINDTTNKVFNDTKGNAQKLCIHLEDSYEDDDIKTVTYCKFEE